jgi:hypothetical protein
MDTYFSFNLCEISEGQDRVAKSLSLKENNGLRDGAKEAASGVKISDNDRTGWR